ncbi:unnamed protein product [Durusdinium trenchii]|uniref:Methyltransferase type 11 domain-containing protein n=1 Tax=Durusdinium trenchii TaxID=1381693 RepID=A0ABP0J255_9DINO
MGGIFVHGANWSSEMASFNAGRLPQAHTTCRHERGEATFSAVFMLWLDALSWAGEGGKLKDPIAKGEIQDSTSILGSLPMPNWEKQVPSELRARVSFELTPECGENELRYPPNIFDLVVIRETFMYLEPEDKAVILRKVKKMLRPGGRVLIIDYCRGRPALSQTFQSHIRRWHYDCSSPAELEELLAHHFEVSLAEDHTQDFIKYMEEGLARIEENLGPSTWKVGQMDLDNSQEKIQDALKGLPEEVQKEASEAAMEKLKLYKASIESDIEIQKEDYHWAKDTWSLERQAAMDGDLLTTIEHTVTATLASVLPTTPMASVLRRPKARPRPRLRTCRWMRVRCAEGNVVVRMGGLSEVPKGVAKPWSHARRVLEKQGLVLLRGLLPKDAVACARTRLLTELKQLKAVGAGAELSPECAEGEVPMPSLLRRLDLQALPEVQAVLEHAALFDATARLLQTDEVVTTCYKWLRAVPPKAFTGPHMDRAYVGAGPRLTAWIPLGDVRCGQEELGALCWVPGSHRDPQITERFKDYDRAGSDGERSGWLASDPAALALPSGCHWESTHFDAGDVAVFGMDLLHTTLPNGQNSFRLSCDTRWQPLDAPPPPPGVITGPWKTAALSHPWCCFAMALLRLLALLRLIPLACSGSCAAQRGAAARAWDSIEPECRDKLEKNRTAAALRCLEGHFWEARGPGQRAGDFFTTLRKLRHDAEMFTYLEQEGKVTAEVKKLFRGVFHSAKKQHEDPDKVFELAFQEDTADRKLWQKANNKAVYWDPAGHELPARTLRAKPAALKGLEDSFVATGRAVSDKFLTDKTLRQLKRFLQDGLASPILAQVVDGLRQALPGLLPTHLPLQGLRVWKADNSALPRPPADGPELEPGGAVNLLLWLVPSSALHGSAADALQLFNATDAAERGPVAAPVASIRYAANRAVFWREDLRAVWSGPSWKSGFLQRGLHLLFTFGLAQCEA